MVATHFDLLPFLGLLLKLRTMLVKLVNPISNVRLAADHISHQTSQCMKTSLKRGREVVNKHMNPDNRTGYHGCDSFASSWVFLRCS